MLNLQTSLHLLHKETTGPYIAITSIEQEKTMSAKLSNFIQDSETRKTPVEKKILKPPTTSNGQQDDEAKNMFAGAVFNNCQF